MDSVPRHCVLCDHPATHSCFTTTEPPMDLCQAHAEEHRSHCKHLRDGKGELVVLRAVERLRRAEARI